MWKSIKSLLRIRIYRSRGGSAETQNVDISKIKSPTHGLQFHDLRHHAITELAESQASDPTIMMIAGHVSSRMPAHYTHVRMDAKRKALDALSGRCSGGSYGHKPRHKFAR